MNISGEMFREITGSIRSDSRNHHRDEKRKEARVGLSGRIAILPVLPAEVRSPTEVMVRNLSASGLGILHKEALKPGERFIVQLVFGTKMTALVCTVRWCHSISDDLFSIGASFEPQNREVIEAVPETKTQAASAADKAETSDAETSATPIT